MNFLNILYIERCFRLEASVWCLFTTIFGLLSWTAIYSVFLAGSFPFDGIHKAKLQALNALKKSFVASVATLFWCFSLTTEQLWWATFVRCGRFGRCYGSGDLRNGDDQFQIEVLLGNRQKGQKRRNWENPRPIVVRFVSCKKRNVFFTNERDLKNIDGKQHVLVCEDLTPLRYKLLTYMQKSCYDTFGSCCTRNGSIKAKLKTSENGSPSLYLMISSNTELILIINRWTVAKHLT